jgi:hypothetical protein
VIERMRRFAAALMRPDGQPALFNDGPLDFAPVLDLPAPPEGLSVFPETGYAVVRSPRIWLAFDCGPPAPAFLPAHAHADALSFQLWIDGQPVVVDPGTFTYEPGPDRDWFRSTAAHSTVAIDGRNQFELWGTFRSGPLPQVRLVSTDPLVAEVRTAYARHTRSIAVSSDAVEIADEVEGKGHAVLSSSLPLADAARVEVDADPSVERSDTEGWLSETMFARTRIPVARSTGTQSLPARSGWRLRLPSAG